ncbi:SDR family oxidoreductase [Acinetobacter gerneri]|jgi:NADP-dependent 3-hydroxy acid dehydrogenase YdfG|uniref:SDR family oxidoreductase n=1 Tax=Acinetobacter gerneri TaxID=202952 RepID=UPI0023F3C6CE|nr:SDR family oxidoreductase [Acinetobacter gerneri]MCH4246117.1 SDR family oxidoreductase [Acinetobacter gerneri]
MGKVNLKDKVVAVTGGARGIGLCISKALIAQGAKVVIGDIDIDLAQAEANKIGAKAFQLDVRDRESFQAFIDQSIQHYGSLYSLINNAGIMPMGAFLDEDPALADAQIDINFRGVVYGMQSALPALLAQKKGHIINVASLAGRFALAGSAVYSGTKFAVVGLTEAVAGDYRDSGVDFTVIMPSKVSTELTSGLEEAGKIIPTVSPEQVADVVVHALIKPKLFVAVPDYLHTAYGFYALLPSWMQQGGRRLINDRRILNKMDKKAHESYANRIQKLAE